MFVIIFALFFIVNYNIFTCSPFVMLICNVFVFYVSGEALYKHIVIHGLEIRLSKFKQTKGIVRVEHSVSSVVKD